MSETTHNLNGHHVLSRGGQKPSWFQVFILGLTLGVSCAQAAVDDLQFTLEVVELQRRINVIHKSIEAYNNEFDQLRITWDQLYKDWIEDESSPWSNKPFSGIKVEDQPKGLQVYIHINNSKAYAQLLGQHYPLGIKEARTLADGICKDAGRGIGAQELESRIQYSQVRIEQVSEQIVVYTSLLAKSKRSLQELSADVDKDGEKLRDLDGQSLKFWRASKKIRNELKTIYAEILKLGGVGDLSKDQKKIVLALEKNLARYPIPPDNLFNNRRSTLEERMRDWNKLEKKLEGIYSEALTGLVAAENFFVSDAFKLVETYAAAATVELRQSKACVARAVASGHPGNTPAVADRPGPLAAGHPDSSRKPAPARPVDGLPDPADETEPGGPPATGPDPAGVGDTAKNATAQDLKSGGRDILKTVGGVSATAGKITGCITLPPFDKAPFDVGDGKFNAYYDFLAAIGLQPLIVMGKKAPTAADLHQIYSLSPAVGNCLSKGSEVQLAIFTEEELRGCRVPYLNGQSEKSARRLLESRDLFLERAYGDEKPGDAISSGNVYRQYPEVPADPKKRVEMNIEVPCGTAIRVWVYSSPGQGPRIKELDGNAFIDFPEWIGSDRFDQGWLFPGSEGAWGSWEGNRFIPPKTGWQGKWRSAWAKYGGRDQPRRFEVSVSWNLPGDKKNFIRFCTKPLFDVGERTDPIVETARNFYSASSQVSVSFNFTNKRKTLVADQFPLQPMQEAARAIFDQLESVAEPCP